MKNTLLIISAICFVGAAIAFDQYREMQMNLASQAMYDQGHA